MTTVLHRGLAPVRQAFANGMTVIAEQTTTHPAVTIFISLHAGSGYDPSSAVGVSHFVSRVIDRGSDRRSADDIAEALDGRGVALSVGVLRHSFTLGCTCLAEDLEAMLDLLADIVRRPSFPAAEVDTRRAEIVTAIRQDQDNPAVLANDGLFARLYPGGHPYGRPTKGTIPGVESLTRDALRAFHEEHFGPAGSIVVLVGDVERERAAAAAASAFSDWSHPTAPALVPPPAPKNLPRTVATIPVGGKAQSDIAYGFTAVRRL